MDILPAVLARGTSLTAIPKTGLAELRPKPLI
jgi:hypothetical protein